MKKKIKLNDLYDSSMGIGQNEFGEDIDSPLYLDKVHKRMPDYPFPKVDIPCAHRYN